MEAVYILVVVKLNPWKCSYMNENFQDWNQMSIGKPL